VGLRFVDRWIWDFWFADDGTDRHVFYLQAPRSLGRPELRHRNATIGHAVSTDLRTWEVLPDVLGPGPAGRFDDLATWTGSVIRAGGLWHLFHTGIARATVERVQRIGVATSTDLIQWAREGAGPVIEPDPRWYVANDGSGTVDQAWRDPFVFADPAGDGYHALITATLRDGPPGSTGAIAHAMSPDLRSWTVREPLVTPAGFGMLEVPQVSRHGRDVVLAFSSDDASLAPERRTEGPGSGTYLCRGPTELGSFRLGLERPFRPFDAAYAGKVVRLADGSPGFLGFVNVVDGMFVGALGDPVPLDVSAIPACDPAPDSAAMGAGRDG
jgi:beta-fructofuranosidase